MRNRYKYRTAYVELNGTHEICALAPCNDKEVFTYKNVDFYPHAIIPTLTKVLNMNYDRVIVDFGIININTLKEFMRCDVKLSVCTHSNWNTGTLSDTLNFFESNKITNSKGPKLLFNLVEKEKTIPNHNIKYQTAGFPYLEDPFLINSSLFGTLDKISERN